MKARVVLIGAVCAVLSCVSSLQAIVIIDTVPVGNPGNANDTHGDNSGGVGYAYNISKLEATSGQYRDFLNAVAAEDTYGLYNTNMNSDTKGCQITRNGSSGSYTYDFSGRPSGTESDWVNRAVAYVSWGDAARFANWLHNGQPTGGQGLATTEDGSYYLNGAISDEALQAVTREADATWVIPTEDEWYKAAYYKSGGTNAGYWDYATSSNSTPNNDLVEPTDPGNNVTFYQDATYPDPAGYTIGSPYYRTEVGAHENSDSPYGTFDQGGNVWEWNETISIDVHGFSFRGLCGGSFDGNYGLFADDRGDYYPTHEVYSFGFRVAEVPEPTTLGLLVMGGVVLLRRRAF